MRAYLKHGRWGQFLLIAGDMISDHFNLYGQWAETEIDLCRWLLNPDSVVVEAGANIGTHTVALAKICNIGKIIALEPQSKLFGILAGNVAINNCDNVELYHAALSEADKVIEIQTGNYDHPFNYGSFSIDKGFATERPYPGYIRYERAKTRSIDSIVDELSLNRLDLLKIDVEGHEEIVIRGGCNAIDQFGPDLIVEAVHKEQTQHLTESLIERGYDAYWVACPRFLPTNYNCTPIMVEGYDFSLLFRTRGKPVPKGLQRFESVSDLDSGVSVVTDFIWINEEGFNS
jgi:FkbM family methyltransferase